MLSPKAAVCTVMISLLGKYFQGMANLAPCLPPDLAFTIAFNICISTATHMYRFTSWQCSCTLLPASAAQRQRRLVPDALLFLKTGQRMDAGTAEPMISERA